MSYRSLCKKNNVFTGLSGVAVIFALLIAFTFAVASKPAFAQNNLMAKYTESSEGAVVVIRFNQERVYFHDSLKRVVAAVAEKKQRATYDVISVIPSVSKHGREDDRIYAANLRNVISSLSRLGVSVDQINVGVADSDKVENQEIRIFVR